jgi:phage baseplate assembly protein W
MSGSLFVGWPLDVPDLDGRLSYSTHSKCLREALWNVLMTDPGERLMQRDYGGGLSQWIGQPNTQSTRQLIASTINAAVAKWEQRVALATVNVATDPNDASQVIVTLSYTARGLPGAPPEQLSLTLNLGGT